MGPAEAGKWHSGLMAGSTCVEMRAKSRPAFLEVIAYEWSTANAGGVMSIQTIDQTILPDKGSSFRIRDVLWTLGMCTVSLGLTPFVAFYALLVA
jgi:hypothetical protein